MVATDELLCLKNAGIQISMFSTSNEQSALMAIEKIKILVAVMELPDKQHFQFIPFGPFSSSITRWQCCLTGCSKTAPRILIFSIAMGAKPIY